MYVLDRFLPEVTNLFSKHPALRHIYFVEDDCKLKPGTTFKDVRKVALAAGGKIGWLGYYTREGKPRYGAHLVSFSSASLIHLEGLLEQYRDDGLPACDTVLHRLETNQPEAFYVEPESIASQATHALTGRR